MHLAPLWSDRLLWCTQEAAARVEFEEELQAQANAAAQGSNAVGYGINKLTQMYNPGVSNAERVHALREVCAINLGGPVFELIYGYVRKRWSQASVEA